MNFIGTFDKTFIYTSATDAELNCNECCVILYLCCEVPTLATDLVSEEYSFTEVSLNWIYANLVLFLVFKLSNLERKWQHLEQNNFVMKECILLQLYIILLLINSYLYCVSDDTLFVEIK